MSRKHRESGSDSDGSEDELSASSSQADTANGKASTASVKSKKKRSKSRHDWEILQGLRGGQKCEEKPDKYEGYLMKKRKWPLKGWHKRYFVLENGILTYAKSPGDIQKGKYHGVIDVGLSVVSYTRRRRRVDIDAEEHIYHIKIKDHTLFDKWMDKFKHHRLYRQHEFAYGTINSPKLTELKSPVEELAPLPASTHYVDGTRSYQLSKDSLRRASLKNRSLSGLAGGQSNVAAWLLDTDGIHQCNRDLNITQNHLCELRDTLEEIRSLPLSSDVATDCQDPDPAEKQRSRKGKRKESKKGNLSSNTLCVNMDSLHFSSSNPNLAMLDDKPRPLSLGDYPESARHHQRIEDIKLRENFVSKAEQVHGALKTLFHMISTERDRIKQACDCDISLSAQPSTNSLFSLKQSLAEALGQNADLKAKLGRIHAESSVSDVPGSPLSPIIPQSPLQENTLLTHSMSVESCSMSEYHDAEENLDSQSETSSEASDDASSELSDEDIDTDMAHNGNSEDTMMSTSFRTGRRLKLPVQKPDTGDISLWNILFKNIGKDLTKISMPVTLNEPLSMLQRLCEELEYSELLDKASECDDPYERMLYVAAFAVSSYSSSYYRVGHKPFNPLQEETFECIREDKGWRFIAEQVSHHPPISACYADSRNFIMWQDIRIKTKFWGKSMEIQPIGTVNVLLPKYQDLFTWNKVTTCVHNILGGQRWVDQYGEMSIRNRGIECKLTFTKANQWSVNKSEVYGHISSPENHVVHKLFGKWNEVLYCGQPPSAKCVWRPGAMPDDCDLYYGFSRFAIEMNEVDPEQCHLLPPTDSRFRPDQRFLENGKVKEAETEKHRIEQAQRERRKKREEISQPRWFTRVVDNGQESYSYTKQYWERRKDPGFINMPFSKLW